jgi:uncharacterized protein YndB with AHSA1/START domain
MTHSTPSMTGDRPAARFATLTFQRDIQVPPVVVWQAWSDPVARAIWAAPTPEVTVEFLEADTRVGGREISLCKVEGQPTIRCENGWLVLQSPELSVSSEVISCEDRIQSAALVTAEIRPAGAGSRMEVTVQLSSLSEDMEGGYRQGFGAGLDNLVGTAERTMILQRRIEAPVAAVWGAWVNPETLPQWWGPDGFTCRTDRIDLRSGGEWVFDMIGPDGTVFPNHHLYREITAQQRLSYALLWGENGPKHADAWARFEEVDGATLVTLGMVFNTGAEFQDAKGFGAIELGHQTLAKLEAFIARP